MGGRGRDLVGLRSFLPGPPKSYLFNLEIWRENKVTLLQPNQLYFYPSFVTLNKENIGNVVI